MRAKIMVAALLLVLASGLPLAAQPVDFSEYEDGFQDFADGVAGALPMNAAVGLNWSDAYIGNFPHFGVGITVGAATMPYDALAKIEDMFGVSIADEFPEIETYGAPIPAVAVEGRIGGFILPFDVGVKVGYLPPESKALLPSGVTADYLMFGADVRYALLKGGGLLPALSVGAGYTYLKGQIGMSDFVGSQTIGSVAGMTLELDDPNLNFVWQASVIDLKAQLSKRLAIVTPYVGVGASYAIAKAGGGLEAEVTHDGGQSFSAAQIEAIEDLTGEEFDPDQGFYVASQTTGWAFRAFGGVSLNLFLLKLDLTGMYNFLTGNYGGSLSARIQL